MPYTIPKKQYSTAVEGNRHLVEKSSRGEAELWDKVRHSCLDETAIPRCWRVRHTTVVRQEEWQKNFQIKRQELKKEMNNRDPKVAFAFGLVRKDTLADNVCEFAAFKVQDLYVPLGDLDLGVNLSMHADVLMAWARKKQYSNPCLIIYKILKGRVKSLKVRLTTTGDHFYPTPNYDCHVLRETGTADADELEQRMINSQIFLYEYDDECEPAKHPRHCLPYAVICFNRDTSLASESKPAYDPATAKMWLDHVERNDKLETLRKDSGLCDDGPSEESEQDDQIYPDHEIFAVDNVISKEQNQLESQTDLNAPSVDSHENIDPESSDYSDVCLSGEESASEPEKEFHMENDSELEQEPYQLNDQAVDNASDNEDDDHACTDKSPKPDSINGNLDPESSNYSDVSLTEEESFSDEPERDLQVENDSEQCDQMSDNSAYDKAEDTSDEKDNMSAVQDTSEDDSIKSRADPESSNYSDVSLSEEEPSSVDSEAHEGTNLSAVVTDQDGNTSAASNDNPQVWAESQKDALLGSENRMCAVKSLSSLEEASDKQYKTLTKVKRRMSRQKRNEQASKRKPSLLDIDSDSSGDEFSKHEENHPVKLISAIPTRKRKNADNHIVTDGKQSPPTQRTAVSLESCPYVERKPRKRCISTSSRGTTSDELGNENQSNINGNAMLVASEEDIFANSDLSDHAPGVGHTRRVGRFKRDSESSEPGSSSNKLGNLCDDNNNSCETGAELDGGNVCSRLRNIPSDVSESDDPPIDITGHDASAYSKNMLGGERATPSSTLESVERQYQETMLKLQYYRLKGSRACEAQLDVLSVPTSQQNDEDLVTHRGNMATDVPEYESDWSGVAFSPCSLSDGETGDKNSNSSEVSESDDFDVHLFKSSSETLDDTRHCNDMLQVHPSQSNTDDLERELLNSDCNLKGKKSDHISKSPEESVETASNSPQVDRISNVKDDHVTDHEINEIMSTPYVNCGDETDIDVAENESDWSGVASSRCSPDEGHSDSNNNDQVGVEDVDDKDSAKVNILNDNGNELDERYTCVDVAEEGYMSAPSAAVEDESNHEGNEKESQSPSRQQSITESKKHACVNINTEVDNVLSILDNNKPPVLTKNTEVNVDGVSNLCNINLDVPCNEDKTTPLPQSNRDGQSAPRQIQRDHPARHREHREIHVRTKFSRMKGNGDRGRNFRRELKSRYSRNFEHKKDLNHRRFESRGKYHWTGWHSTRHQNYHRKDNFNRIKPPWPKYYDTRGRNGSAYSPCTDRVKVPSLKRDHPTMECMDELKPEQCKVVDYNHGRLDAINQNNYGSSSFQSHFMDVTQCLAGRATRNQVLRTDFMPPLPKDPPPLKPRLPSVCHETADKNLETVDMEIDMNTGHQETVVIDYYHGNNTAPVQPHEMKYNEPWESTEKQLHVMNFAVQEVQSSVVLKTTTITSPACPKQLNSLGERDRPNKQQQEGLDERRMEGIRCLQEEMAKTNDLILKKAFELSINRLLRREPVQPTTQSQSLTSKENATEKQGHKPPSASRPEAVCRATLALPEQADKYRVPRSINRDAVIEIPLTVDPSLPYDKRPSDPRRARSDLYGQMFEVDVSPVKFKSSRAKLSSDPKNKQPISCNKGGIPQRPGEHLRHKHSNSKSSSLSKSKKESQSEQKEPLYVSTSIADVISSTPISPEQEEPLLNRSFENGTLKQCTPLRSRTADSENSVKGCRNAQETASVSQQIEESLSDNPSIEGKGNRGNPLAHASVKGMNEDTRRVVLNSSKEESTPTGKRNVMLSGLSKEIGTITQDTSIQSREELKNTPPDLRSSIEYFKRTRQSCGNGSERNIGQDAQTSSNNTRLHSDNISTGREDKLISAEKSESDILTVQKELHQKTYTTADHGSITTSHTNNAVSNVGSSSSSSSDRKVQLITHNNECDENVVPGSYHHMQRKPAENLNSDAKGKKRKSGDLIQVIAKKRAAERNDDSVEEVKIKSIKDAEIDSIFSRLSELKRTLAELDQKRAETHKRTVTKSKQSISDHTIHERQDHQIGQMNLTSARHVQIEEHVRQNGRHRGQDRRQPGHSQNRGTKYQYNHDNGHYEHNGHRSSSRR